MFWSFTLSFTVIHFLKINWTTCIFFGLLLVSLGERTKLWCRVVHNYDSENCIFTFSSNKSNWFQKCILSIDAVSVMLSTDVKLISVVLNEKECQLWMREESFTYESNFHNYFCNICLWSVEMSKITEMSAYPSSFGTWNQGIVIRILYFRDLECI